MDCSARTWPPQQCRVNPSHGRRRIREPRSVIANSLWLKQSPQQKHNSSDRDPSPKQPPSMNAGILPIPRQWPSWILLPPRAPSPHTKYLRDLAQCRPRQRDFHRPVCKTRTKPSTGYFSARPSQIYSRAGPPSSFCVHPPYPPRTSTRPAPRSPTSPTPATCSRSSPPDAQLPVLSLLRPIRRHRA